MNKGIIGHNVEVQCFLYKIITHFISLVRVKTGVSVRERQRQTENCYIDPYLLLFCHEWALPLSWYLLVVLVTLCLCDWPLLLWVPAYMISCYLCISSCQSIWPASHCQPAWAAYPLCITVYLFTQLDHDGSVKGQYATIYYCFALDQDLDPNWLLEYKQISDPVSEYVTL